MPLTTETGFANIHGGRLYWEAASEGEPLVFVHGFTLDTRMWDDQWEVFAERYRVYRYDARGFGKSSLPEGRFSHSDDLRALMDSFGVDRFHLVGLSMGGAIGVDYAVSFPDDLLSLTLIDAGSGGRLSTHARSFGETARVRGMEAAKADWLNDGLFIPARRNELVRQRLETIVGDYSGWHWVVERIDQVVAEPPSMQRLHEIVAPTLVLVGELDVPRMQDNANALSKIPGARKVVIADAGHMANMEKPAEVNEHILAFLASLPETRQE
jgi:pimeloyl-ACP methyl ester carboxylesterase